MTSFKNIKYEVAVYIGTVENRGKKVGKTRHALKKIPKNTACFEKNHEKHGIIIMDEPG